MLWLEVYDGCTILQYYKFNCVSNDIDNIIVKYVYYAYASDLPIAALRFWRQIFRYDLSGNVIISNLPTCIFISL